MFWLNETRRISTAKNGPLVLRRIFGVWEILSPDSTQQSSDYIERMWRTVLNQAFNPSPQPQVCLILGVCLGNILTLIGRRFPSARVVGVDWDGELLALGKKLLGRKYPKNLELIEGDAGETAKNLKEKFDFIVVDLFSNRNVAPVVAEKDFIKNLSELLTADGIVAVNIYDQPNILQNWPEVFEEFDRVYFGTNAITLYRHQ